MGWFGREETEREKECLKRAGELVLTLGEGEIYVYAAKVGLRAKLYAEGFTEDEVENAIDKIF
jgi:hypothetical protein